MIARAPLPLAAALAALAACRAGAPFVRVDVAAQGVPPVSQLEMVSSFGGSSVDFAVPAQPAASPIPFPNSFTVQLPAGGRGQLELTASARDAGDMEVATGSASTTVDGNGDYDVSLSMMAHPEVWTQQVAPSGMPVLLNFWSPPGASDVYLVGYGPTILHTTNHGATWGVQSAGVMGQNLIAIWGSSASDVYAVGTAGTIVHSTGNGTWSSQSSGTKDLYSVWGTGMADVWIGGSAGTLLHSSGSGTWSAQTSPTAAVTIWNIWGTAGTMLLADDMGRIFRSTDGGGSFSQSNSSATTTLFQIWGSSKLDLYATGKAHTLIHSADGGLSWMGLNSGANGDLLSVWGSGPNDVYVVGAAGTILHSSDGTTWLSQTSGVGTAITLNTVWGTGAGDVYAAGDSGTILHLQ
jgi:photosystem II stability/assembly factor-like uncharacterized protein